MNSLHLNIFYFQTTLSGVVALLCFFFLAKRQKITDLIGLLFFCGFLSNALAYLLFFTKNSNNLAGSIYDLCLIVIAGLLYNHVTQGRYRKFFTLTTTLYLIFALLNLFFIQKTQISSYNKLLGSFLMISYSVFYFYRLMADMPTMQIQKLPMFWFNSGFLIYHAGTVFLWAFTTYLTDVLKNNFLVYMMFHNCLNIAEHFIVLVGLYYQRILNTTDN